MHVAHLSARAANMKVDKPFTMVIFGASGDLTHRKLIPALYSNFKKKRLPAELRIVGFARRNWSDDRFRYRLRNGVKEHAGSFDEAMWKDFARAVRYFQGDLDVPGDYDKLRSYLKDMEKNPADRLYYLATAPDFYGSTCKHLADAGMSTEDRGHHRAVGKDMQCGKR